MKLGDGVLCEFLLGSDSKFLKFNRIDVVEFVYQGQLEVLLIMFSMYQLLNLLFGNN